MRRTALILASMTLVVLLASGAALAINTIQYETDGGPRTVCYGTKERDKMLGTDGKNVMYGKGRGDILKGFDYHDVLGGDGGNDELYGGLAKDDLRGGRGEDILKGSDGGDRMDGEEGNDELYGGPGEDFLRGEFVGLGNDALDGELGDDWYGFVGNEWGNDHITDTALPDNDYLTGNTISFSGGGDRDLTTNLTINLNSDSEPVPEVKNAAGTSTINWSGNVIDNVWNEGGGNDEITGNDAANDILSRGGADVVDAGPGDDYIYVSDADGEIDTVDCGEGSDTVGSDPNDVLTNCETVPSGNP